jgi:cyclopropane fatty-acyl-phospholipid synthase-like methyltransferase
MFDLRYRFGRPRWDTGVTPPELVAFVEGEGRAPGRALDLGCGTGTNVVYLARHGWDAVGADFSPRAIGLAHRRARDAGVGHAARFIVADVTRLPDLGAPFDLALDIGCLHSVPPERRADYARGLVARLAPGATYLLYAFCPPDRFGIARSDVEQLFSPTLAPAAFAEGAGRPSAWYRFRRAP